MLRTRYMERVLEIILYIIKKPHLHMVLVIKFNFPCTIY